MPLIITIPRPKKSLIQLATSDNAERLKSQAQRQVLAELAEIRERVFVAMGSGVAAHSPLSAFEVADECAHRLYSARIMERLSLALWTETPVDEATQFAADILGVSCSPPAEAPPKPSTGGEGCG